MAIKPSTQSKSNMPVICKAKGKYVWDVNWNKYLDFTGSNLTNILGYRPTLPSVPNYPGVSDVEQELTKLLSSYTQTKHFRYFKNGSDAVNCSIRLARYILCMRDGGVMPVVCYLGYAGSHDSYAWTINNNGIPYQNSVQPKTVKEEYLPKKIDILVFESRYAEYADKIDAKIKIIDCLKDGVRALYPTSKTTPRVNGSWDVACFESDEGIKVYRQYEFYLYGKSIANGSPLAVMTGKDELMEKIDEIYYSTTFGSNPGDMRECIRTIKDFEKGKEKYFKLYNYALDKLPKWQTITDHQQKTFQREGVLYNGYWAIMFPHTYKDIDNVSNLCKDLNIK